MHAVDLQRFVIKRTKCPIRQGSTFSLPEDNLTALIPLQATLMASYERGLNQPTLMNCLHEALLAALIMVNIAQMNSAYGKTDD